jgi:hypothetical protein
VSYIHWESTPDPAAPLKSSLKTVDQPDGGPGTAAGAAAVADAAWAAGAARAEADGTVAAVSAITGAMMASARTPLGRQLVARLLTRVARCDVPGMPGLLNPLLRVVDRKFPIDNRNVTLLFHRVNHNNR